jgi:hypothetical protein
VEDTIAKLSFDAARKILAAQPFSVLVGAQLAVFELGRADLVPRSASGRCGFAALQIATEPVSSVQPKPGSQRRLIRGHPHADPARRLGLIVMASHGRTGVARVFRGSVAAGVADYTHRPILIVRPFRDAEHRADLEHADQLPPDQAEAVRRAVAAAQPS